MEWLGFPGAPLALAINAWLSFFLLFSYVKRTPGYSRCLPDVWGNPELLQGWGLLIRMGAAGAAAMMGVWWSWELLSGMAGILGEIPLAAHVAMQQFGMFFFPFFLGGGMAATARVGNLLGAGDPQRARVCAQAAIIGTVVVQGFILSPVLFARHKFAYIYTSSDEVAALSAQVAWFFVLNQWITSNSVVLQGILTGCGRQAINAKVPCLLQPNIYTTYNHSIIPQFLGLFYDPCFPGVGSSGGVLLRRDPMRGAFSQPFSPFSQPFSQPFFSRS